MDPSIEKPHTSPVSDQLDHGSAEKESKEKERLQPPAASEGTEHNDAEKEPSQISAPEQDDPQFPKGIALALILFSVWLALFLVAIVSFDPLPSPKSNWLLINTRTEPS
jgi:hypothetical protein